MRADTLALLQEWTPIRSSSGNSAELRRMAGILVDHLRRMGAEIVPDGLALDPPIVHARFDRGAPTTLLLYNMYDVMPAEADGWTVPPFVGGIVDRPEGLSYVARGAENNKGPLAGLLVALEHLLPTLTANIELLIEGEEESGSMLLRRYLATGVVRRAKMSLFPSFCEYGGGPPRLYLGSKGIAHGRVSVQGGAWGGPSRSIHSSNAPWIDNPAWALVRALAGLADGTTGELGRSELPAAAEPLLAALSKTFDPAAELRFRSTNRFSQRADPADLLRLALTGVTLNLSQLRTLTADGRAAIPAAAEARFDLRTPPGLDILDCLERLRGRMPSSTALLVDDAYPGHHFPLDAPGVSALIGVYRAAGADPQIWPWAIGANPAYAFADISPSFLIGGLGRGGNAHGIDEFVTLAGLDRFLASLCAWLPASAAAPGPVGGG